MFDNGAITGYGRMISSNKYVYLGNYKDGLYDGNGKLTLRNGTII